MKKNNKKRIVGRNFRSRGFSALFSVVVLFICLSCEDDKVTIPQYDPSQPVQLKDIAPTTGGIALPVVITGSNFGTDKSKVKLFFDDKEAVIITAQNEHLYAVVPKQRGGEHSVRVVVDGQNEATLADKKFDYVVASSVTTVAGTGTQGTLDGPALSAQFYAPWNIDVDDRGNILLNDFNWYVKLISLKDNIVTTLYTGKTHAFYGATFSPDYSTYYATVLSTSYTRIAYTFYREGNWAEGLVVNTDGAFTDIATGSAFDDKGNMFVIGYNCKVGRIDGKNGKIDVLGTYPGLKAYFSMTYNPKDKLMYVASHIADVIFRFDPSKEFLAASDFELYSGGSGYGFFDGPREEARFNTPRGITCDKDGYLYVADTKNHAIRVIDPDGMVSTFAGGNGAGYKDGVVETSKFYDPYDVAVDPDGFVYVADYTNRMVRCIAVQ